MLYSKHQLMECDVDRWNGHNMFIIGSNLFDKIHKRKMHSHHNHEIHFMARDRQWLPQGIQSLVDGNYEPRCLKRYYFTDEMVDQLHISDRIFQHILLRILKPTFQFVMNPNCYHLNGPTGVKNATQKIREVLQNTHPKYFIRTDIKSFYKSIPQYKLIQDIKKYYDDPKLISMLANIIKNPIDTPYGYKNPDSGIALRGPLSQFFSGIYLKPLDDAISKMDVTYLRYQDDILILCNTKRQLNRCKRKMMQVMHERHLRLSKRKTCMGEIEQSGFHFLGIEYPPTQIADNTNTTPVELKKNEKAAPTPDHYLSDEGGG
jgi:RNA-directed DNA polymerase